MKLDKYYPNGQLLRVAPLAGAWIETGESELNVSTMQVAPLAGAWIETLLRFQ